MVKLLNRILPTAKLPFEVCKGTVNQRFKLAHKYTNKFIEKMDTYYPQSTPLPVTGFRRCIDETLAPNKIDYFVKRQEEGPIGGTLEPVYKIVCSDPGGEVAYVENGSFNIHLKLDNTGRYILNKSAAVHETRHFLDHICNPKMNILRSNEQFNTEGVDDICFAIHDMTFIDDYVGDPYSKNFMQLYKTCMQEALSKLKPPLQIEILQKIRYSLNLELNAYRHEANYFEKGGFNQKLDKISQILAFNDYINKQAHFVEKLRVVNDFLKTVIKNERSKMNNF